MAGRPDGRESSTPHSSVESSCGAAVVETGCSFQLTVDTFIVDGKRKQLRQRYTTREGSTGSGRQDSQSAHPVKGHEDLPAGGHENCPVVATRSGSGANLVMLVLRALPLGRVV